MLVSIYMGHCYKYSVLHRMLNDGYFLYMIRSYFYCIILNLYYSLLGAVIAITVWFHWLLANIEDTIRPMCPRIIYAYLFVHLDITQKYSIKVLHHDYSGKS